MKNKLFLLLAGLIVLGSFSMAGCAQENGGKAVTVEQLTGQDFRLASVDGKAFDGANPPSMRFDENMRISGNFCNRYTGQASLENGTLTVKQMASTKMLCVDQYLNNLENMVPAMLLDGASVSLEGGSLYIRQGGHEVVYKKGE